MGQGGIASDSVVQSAFNIRRCWRTTTSRRHISIATPESAVSPDPGVAQPELSVCPGSHGFHHRPRAADPVTDPFEEMVSEAHAESEIVLRFPSPVSFFLLPRSPSKHKDGKYRPPSAPEASACSWQPPRQLPPATQKGSTERRILRPKSVLVLATLGPFNYAYCTYTMCVYG